MPPTIDLGYFSVDEKLPETQSPWGFSTRVFVELLSPPYPTGIALLLMDPTTQQNGYYDFNCLKTADGPISTPDWGHSYQGSTFAVPPGGPSFLPTLIFISSEIDSNFGVYLIGFYTDQLGWQHAAPALRGPRLFTFDGGRHHASSGGPKALKYGHPVAG